MKTIKTLMLGLLFSSVFLATVPNTAFAQEKSLKAEPITSKSAQEKTRIDEEKKRWILRLGLKIRKLTQLLVKLEI